MISAKKSLGQNFLISTGVARAMIEAAGLSGHETVLEVGPGNGFLTQFLLTRAAKVIAVEKDHRLIPILRQKFASEILDSRLEIIEADILNFSDYQLLPTSYRLVANIPYYLTGELLTKFLTAKQPPTKMVIMLQQEVAERIVAKNGKESILSLSVKVFGEPKYLTKVPAKFFRPRPSVDSAVLIIDNINRERLRGIPESKFFDLVKKGFGSKRKMVRNNPADHLAILKTCGIADTARPETLQLKDWLCLARAAGKES